MKFTDALLTGCRWRCIEAYPTFNYFPPRVKRPEDSGPEYAAHFNTTQRITALNEILRHTVFYLTLHGSHLQLVAVVKQRRWVKLTLPPSWSGCHRAKGEDFIQNTPLLATFCPGQSFFTKISLFLIIGVCFLEYCDPTSIENLNSWQYLLPDN